MGAVRKVANYLGLGTASHYETYADERSDGRAEDARGYDDDYEDGDWESASDRAAKRWQPSDEPTQIVMVHPCRYEDAPVLGRHFRAGRAIVMDVSGMPTPEATRMVDFTAGLVYGCEGRIERIADKVFLVVPANVEITTA